MTLFANLRNLSIAAGPVTSLSPALPSAAVFEAGFESDREGCLVIADQILVSQSLADD